MFINFKSIFVILALTLMNQIGFCEVPHFTIVPLGTTGGIFENNLSSYLIAEKGSTDFIALDAGTLCSSIKTLPSTFFTKIGIKAVSTEDVRDAFFKNHVKAYLISHAHLDHISGLVICSTADGKKPIIATQPTMDILQNSIFNWKVWPNFADAGIAPFIKKYQYATLNYAEAFAIPKVALKVTAYPLSHGKGYASTAFLLEANGYYLLYLGDTGADRIEQSSAIKNLWQIISPLIKEHKLVGIMIEVSNISRSSSIEYK